MLKMDWTTLLRSLQADFIHRLKAGHHHLLHSRLKGSHSELTVISGKKLNQLRDFCWEMVDKYKHTSNLHPKNIFVNNMKGKLGEEVVKTYFGDLITEVDYERRIGGDGMVDFALTSNPNIGIQVKARHGNLNKVRWSIHKEEINRNSILICILIQEKVSVAQARYNLILAGFLPTKTIKFTGRKASFGINDLLYGGGMKNFLKTGADKSCFNLNDAYLYYSRGIARQEVGNKQEAVMDFTEAIQINPNYASAYYNRGKVYSETGDYRKSLEDFTEAIQINPNYAAAYFQRCVNYTFLKDYQRAIEDIERAINLYQQQGNYESHQQAIRYQSHLKGLLK